MADIHLGPGPHVHCVGKGRKERRTPLLTTTITVLRSWIGERDAGTALRDVDGSAAQPGRGRETHPLAATRAALVRPSLAGKHVTLHTLRHTAAMRLLPAGVDVTVIALWLGHEQIATTNIYLHADITIKENAIAKITPQDAVAGRYQPPDPILAFLAGL